MFVTRLFKLLALCLAGLAIGLGSYTVFVSPVFGREALALPTMQATPEAAQEDELIMSFDVSEDFTKFVSDEAPVFEEDGLPAHGNAFVTQGYIYPSGTLTSTNGVLENGEPEFPDLVLGQWTCWGYHIGEGAHTTNGAWVITNQLYQFGEELGEATVTTTGYELADQDKPFRRAITGGTGPYAGASGEVIQTFLGFNASHGVNLKFELKLAPEAEPAAETQ